MSHDKDKKPDEKPKVDKEEVKKAIKDREKIVKNNQIVKKCE